MRAINFRPKVDPGKLLQIAKKQQYSDLSGFINDAIEEKIRHIHEDPQDHKLVNSIKKAVYEYNGWTFSKPSAKEAASIRKVAKDMRLGKTKSIPLSEVIHRLETAPLGFRKTTPKEHHEIMEEVKQMKAGRIKTVRARPIR